MSIPLGRFALLAPLAEGGMGVVWRAIDPRLKVPVAIKLVGAEKAEDPEYVASFQREVRAVARLDHPGIIRVHDFGVVEREASDVSGGRLRPGSPYLVMEYASSTLGAQLAHLDWLHLRHIIDQLLDALAHAHARGVIHRDLKPQNLLVATSRDARPGLKLTDFGIAHALGEQTGHRAGTPAYMAPEQIMGSWRDLGPWTDLYALGCVIWRLATGGTPFAGAKGNALLRAHLREDPPEFRPRFPIPEDVELWLRRLLAKNPEKRFTRANQAKELLALMVPEQKPVRASTLIPLDEEEHHEDSTVRGVSLGQRQQIPRNWRVGNHEEDRTARTERARGLSGLGLFGLRAVPIVGREQARDRIWQNLHASRDQRQLTLLAFTGPEGSGRTRLLDWAAERGHEIGGCDTLRIRCSEEGDPLGRALDELLHTSGLDRVEREERLSGVLMRVDERARSGVLDVMAHLPVPEESLLTFRVLALEAVAQDRRLIVTFDDLDASPDMQAFVAFLQDRQNVRPSPIAAIATARTGFTLPGVPVHALEPFGPHEQHELLGKVLSLSPELALAVGERASGNPGHMLQIVGRWVRDGHLVARPEGFTLSPHATATESLSREAAWSERIEQILDGLPAHAEEMLELAAVLGVHVDDSVWQRVSDDPVGQYRESDSVPFSPKKARIRIALFRRLLDEDLARETEEGWAFRQVGFRDAILARSRAAGRLAQHHRACAVAVDTTFADEDSTASAIGQHLLGAGDAPMALELLMKSIEPTLQRRGPIHALAVIARCEDARRAAGIGSRDRRVLQIQVERARLMQLAGNTDAAGALAREAMETTLKAGQHVLAGECALVLARCHLQKLEWLAAEKALLEGLERLGETSRPGLAASLYSALSEARQQLPNRDATAPLLQAHKDMRKMTGPAAERMRLDLDARICVLQRDWAGAARRAETLVGLARRDNDLPAQHRALAMLGQAKRELGQFDAAETALKEALEISRLLGDAGWPGHLAKLLMGVYRHRGAGAASTMLRRESRTLERLEDGPLLVPLFLVGAAITAWEGDWPRSEQYLQRVQRYGDALEATEDNWVALSDTAQRLAGAQRPAAVMGWKLAQNVAEFARRREWLRTAQEAIAALVRD
ncbi:MAG: protein kinase [Myxococcota bacterium]